MKDFEIVSREGKAQVYTPYNKDFVAKIKLLGGRWNAADKCWVVSEDAAEDVRNAMRAVYGRDDQEAGETVDVELRFEKEVFASCEALTILGRTIAKAYGRDSRVQIGEGVLFLSGEPTSGGSARNWHSTVRAGSVVKLPKLPKAALENAQLPDGVTARVIGQDVDRDALRKEREKLLARLAEIDALLGAEG